ncbi:hypothetical protein PLESTB_001151900 [Pleodorina starrii]|uniref:RAP domain-containing protein n=1 Tax=Pleodorina starrii TaxID=330485 RepID=A0A9W6BRC8_9CHLO|nr:hypothetical protein PLESTB_001151900 [Pleodorina starrii]
MTPIPLAVCRASRSSHLTAAAPQLRNGRWLLGAVVDIASQGRLHSSLATTFSEVCTDAVGVDLKTQQPLVPAAAEHPAAFLRRMLEAIPPHPTPSTFESVRRLLEDSARATNPQVSPLTAGRRPDSTSLAARDANAILSIVTSLLQPSTSHPADRYWARASLPELLLLLSRLRIRSHPKLESALIITLRRGQLPTPDPNTWQKLQIQIQLPRLPPDAASAADAAASGGGIGGTFPHQHRASPPPAPPTPASSPPPPPPSAPIAFRLSQAMASLPVLSHEAWQQLAERHFLGRPGQLDQMSPDQMSLLAAAFARAGYHPVTLFGSIADRLLPATRRLQPGSLARALHAFAALRHHDPQLSAALCEEVLCRMRGEGYAAAAGGGGGGSGGSAAARGGGGGASGAGSADGGGSSLLSLAGAALFGGRSGGRPDRAHRAPQFLLDDLARLAAAAVQLGAGEPAVRRYGIGGGGGSHGGVLGERLMEAVAEEAEEAVAARVRLVLEAASTAAGAQPPPPSQLSSPEAALARVTGTPESRSGGGAGAAASYGDVYVGSVADTSGCDPTDRIAEEAEWEQLPSWGSGYPENSSSSSSSGSSIGSSSLPVDQLKPVMTLLEALVAAAAAGGAAAHAIASRHLVPELPSLEPYLAPQHLVALLAALLPGPAAAAAAASSAMRQVACPYPGPPPPPRLSPSSFSLTPGGAAAAKDGDRGKGQPRMEQSGAVATPGDQLAAVVGALCRRTDPRVFRSARQLLEAWHLLAAARAGGVPEVDDPRVVGALMAPVCDVVVRHVAMLGSAPEAARFIVSCALLSVYDRPALDAITVPLVAALGGGGGGGAPFRRGVGSGGSGGGWSSCGFRAGALTPPALAQLAWAVGQLGYDDEQLLAAIQGQALALSAPSVFSTQHQQQHQQQHTADAAAAAGDGGGDGGAGSGPLLGPLELADVMWCLAVNQFRTNQGNEIRELYLRAASQGVLSIDDPRWLRLAGVHLLLLLGWAGGLGEAAAGQLRSGWFNALSYAWEQQAVAPGEQLAGPTGLPPDPDPPTAAFRQSVAAAARELIRSGALAGSGSGGGGRWRLKAGYVWGMLPPSSDIRLTVPLLLRGPAAPLAAAAPPLAADGLTAGLAGGGGGSEWLVALDLVRCADEAEVPGPRAAADEAAAAAAAVVGIHDPAPSGPEAVSTRDRTHHQQQQQRQEAGCGPQQLGGDGSGRGYGVGGGGGGGGQLLGPARWRQLVLRRLGVVVRPIRQAEWERADGRQQREMLLQAMRL